MWRWLLEVLGSFGFGLAAAVVPVFNNEAYILASQWAGLAGFVPVVFGLGLGNGLGKTLVFVLVRQGKRLPWWRRPSAVSDAEARAPRHPRLAAAWRTWQGWMSILSRLVGDPRWGVPVVALGAATSLPPIYPTTLLAAATRMRVGWFALAVTVGSLARMTALALVARGVLTLL